MNSPKQNSGQEDSRARISATQGSGKVSAAPAPDCSLIGCVPFAWYDRNTCSWRTWQRCFIEGWARYVENWPRAGMMRNGIAYRRQPLAPLTAATGCSSPAKTFPTPYGLSANQGQGDGEFGKAIRNWPTKADLQRAAKVVREMFPTPRVTGQEKLDTLIKRKRLAAAVLHNLTAAVEMYPTPSASSRKGTVSGGHPGLAGGSGNRKKLYRMLGKEEGKKMGCQSLNPNWVEWLMGFPLGWTDLDASETP